LLDQFVLKSPQTENEWREYYRLRWEVLRKPWSQPIGSEKDEHEVQSYHLMVTFHGEVIGVGRIHQSDQSTAQIRYMAVLNAYQRTGIGSLILETLENQARSWGVSKIILNARDSCLNFYKKHNYQPTKTGPVLFELIPHTVMIKTMNC
jgi:N-acetylglutamate synthase-like GNAT family acetyltransferase